MRVVARQRVNEVVSDAVLLERALRQISALRRRLVEVEAAAAVSSSPPAQLRPSFLKTKQREMYRQSEMIKTSPVMKSPSPLLPPPPPTEGKSETTGELSSPPEEPSSHLDDGSKSLPLTLGETPGPGRPREQAPLRAAVPRELRQPGRLVGEERVGDTNRRESFAQKPLVDARPSQRKNFVQVVSGSRSQCETTVTREPVSVSGGERLRQSGPRPLGEEEGDEQEEENGAEALFDAGSDFCQRRSLSLSLLMGGSEAVESTPLERSIEKQEGNQRFRRLQDARRGRDIVDRGQIATVMAAANAAAAAAKTITAAIATAGLSHSSCIPTNKQKRKELASSAGRCEHSRGSARPLVRKPGIDSRTTKAGCRSGSHTTFSTFNRPALAAGDVKRSSVSTVATKVERRGGVSEKDLATKALIERFSCRERELLRELETWKSKCSSLAKANDPARHSGASTGGDVGASLSDGDGGSATRDTFLHRGRRGRTPHPNSVSQSITPDDVASTETWEAASVASQTKVQRKVQATTASGPVTKRGRVKIPDASQAHVEPSRDDTRHSVGGDVRSVSVSRGLVPDQDSNVDTQRLANLEVRTGNRAGGCEVKCFG